ncbi:unnamed protein product, partial [Durusdinium trenchii]
MTIPQQYGITICVKEPSLTVGKILRHCQEQIQRLRDRHGGDQLAVFKIGISQCLEVR